LRRRKMPTIDNPFFEMPCPSCGGKVVFVIGELDVKCETKGQVYAGKFYQLWEGCNNPFCEWSKVKARSLYE
jgi:hypothetical protein